jgi:hypothetical protein
MKRRWLRVSVIHRAPDDRFGDIHDHDFQVVGVPDIGASSSTMLAGSSFFAVLGVGIGKPVADDLLCRAARGLAGQSQ